jgi:hypothetical protein
LRDVYNVLRNFLSCKIQRNCNFADSVLNIQLNVSAQQLVVCRQFDARYTTHLPPKAAHVFLFTLCQLCSMSNTMILQFCVFRLQYSIKRISAAIGDMSNTRCALCPTFAAKYSACSCLRYVNTVRIQLTMILTFCLFRIEYSFEYISAAIADM